MSSLDQSSRRWQRDLCRWVGDWRL